MGLFKMLKAKADSPKAERIEGAATDLDTRFAGLESRIRSLEMEWEDTHLRLRRALGRIDRAAAHDRKHEEEPFEPEQPAVLTREEILRRARERRGH